VARVSESDDTDDVAECLRVTSSPHRRTPETQTETEKETQTAKERGCHRNSDRDIHRDTESKTH